jgi:hypothetical protein
MSFETAAQTSECRTLFWRRRRLVVPQSLLARADEVIE